MSTNLIPGMRNLVKNCLTFIYHVLNVFVSIITASTSNMEHRPNSRVECYSNGVIN